MLTLIDLKKWGWNNNVIIPMSVQENEGISVKR